LLEVDRPLEQAHSAVPAMVMADAMPPALGALVFIAEQ
jgi:hypothetical protein